MSARPEIVLTGCLVPVLPCAADVIPQEYNYSFQFYQEDSGRIEVMSHYLRGSLEVTDDTSLRFQWLLDSITGSSPNGLLPGTIQPYLSELEDERTGILLALAHQFGDHHVELEGSRSEEDDYLSYGIALSDEIEFNQKNTTLAYGINYLNDDVTVPRRGNRTKESLDLFAGVTQNVDQNTLLTANLTVGHSWGYLNDPYKLIQRDEVLTFPDGLGGVITIPIITPYSENRPDERTRGVLQLEGRHYFEKPDAALDATLRFSCDDYGIFSQTAALEWRQAVGDKLQVTPYVRYYHQNAADFYRQTLNGFPSLVPSSDPDGSGPNYSADHRLSSFEALSLGLRLNYTVSDNFALTAAYERYMMEGTGSDSAPDELYPSANIWTVGLKVKF